MNNDLISMIGNLSRSLGPVQALITGLGYLIGVLFIIHAIMKFKKIGESKGGGEKPYGAMAYLVLGAMLVFLPSSIEIFSNTAFGVGNILQYTPFSTYSIYNSMEIVIQTAGLLWFVRGCVLLVYSSEPGKQQGPKGLTFIIAGIFAMNFEGTYAMLNYIMNHLFGLTEMGGSSTGSGS